MSGSAPSRTSDPAMDCVAIVLDSDLPNACRAIYVGGAGDVSITTLKGATVVFSGAVAGSVLPIACTRVNSSATTATNLVALF